MSLPQINLLNQANFINNKIINNLILRIEIIVKKKKILKYN